MPTEYQIQPGDSIISLADQFGLFPDTIWNDSANQELKNKRKDMNIVLPGDTVIVPDKRTSSESCATGQRHVFRRRGIPARFRLQVLDGGRILAGAPYRLIVEGIVFDGATDTDGCIEQFVPAGSKNGLLRVTRPDGEPPLVCRVQFGRMDPADSIPGLEKRLYNLGYAQRIQGQSEAVCLWNALRRFQRDHDLPVTGRVDENTRRLLSQLHETGKSIPGA